MGKKDNNPKELLMKMKEIKAHYNNAANRNPGSNKNFAAKIAELGDKKTG